MSKSEQLERVRAAVLELQEALVDLSGTTDQALLAMALHPDARVALLRAVDRQDLGWTGMVGREEPTFLCVKVREELP